MSFGKYLKEKRLEAGASIKDLAYAIDPSDASKIQKKLIAFEKGTILPDLEEICELAKYLKFDPDEAYKFVIESGTGKIIKNNKYKVKARKKYKTVKEGEGLYIALKFLRILVVIVCVAAFVYLFYSFIDKFFGESASKKEINFIEDKINQFVGSDKNAAERTSSNPDEVFMDGGNLNELSNAINKYTNY